MRRVVVTGLGALSPCGLNLSANWTSMVEGRSGIGLITRFDAAGWPVRFAGEVKGFDPEKAVGKKEARRMDRFCQLATAAADEAVQHAGLDVNQLDPERLGVYVGTGGGLWEKRAQLPFDLREPNRVHARKRPSVGGLRFPQGAADFLFGLALVFQDDRLNQRPEMLSPSRHG